MYYFFEKGDMLNAPAECFEFDAAKECFPIKPHWHYFVEIIYMTHGCAEMYSGGKQYLLSEGDMILFHPKTVHSIYAVDDELPVYSVLKFDINRMSITPSYAPKLRSILRSAEKKCMNIFFSSESLVAQSAEKVTGRCIEEMRCQDYGFDLVIKAELYKLLIEIIRAWRADGFSVDSEAYALDESYDIYNITEFIDSGMKSGIKVAEIAEKCGMSYSYFAKRFSEVYGKTCKEYLEEMRVFKAEEFLLFTDFDLSYISQESGFADCSHMIKSFKKARGITPKQFRIKHGKKAEL